jgi:hypothetical protein
MRRRRASATEDGRRGMGDGSMGEGEDEAKWSSGACSAVHFMPRPTGVSAEVTIPSLKHSLCFSQFPRKKYDVLYKYYSS